MLTTPLAMSAVNVELGNSSTAQLSISSALATMGEATNPDAMQEMLGYDQDWDDVGNGWLEVQFVDGYDFTSYTQLMFSVYNNSEVHSQSETLYWRAYDKWDSLIESGNVATGTIDVENGGWPYDYVWDSTEVWRVDVSWDNSNWITVTYSPM